MTGKEDQQQPQKTSQTGSGQLNPGDEAAPGTPGAGEAICGVCNGSGKVDGRSCQSCGGTGKVVQGIGGA